LEEEIIKESLIMNKVSLVMIIMLFIFLSCKNDRNNLNKDNICQIELNNKILCNTNDFEELKSIDMKDLQKKMMYIKSKLKINKIYSYKYNKNFLKHILIGKWHNDPHGIIIFYKDKTYKMISEGNENAGKWFLNEKGLLLDNFSGKRNLEIESFLLFESKDKKFYSFSIGFDDPHIILSLDTAFIKVQTKID